VDSVDVRPCRNVWMLSFLLLMSYLRCCIAALNSHLLSGVHSLCQILWSLLFSLICCLTSIGHSQVLNASVCSGIAFQPAHCIVSLKNLTAASISSSVLRGTFRVTLSLIRCLKSSQFDCLLHRLGCFFWLMLVLIL
jgi:hypothetical protein